MRTPQMTSRPCATTGGCTWQCCSRLWQQQGTVYGSAAAAINSGARLSAHSRRSAGASPAAPPHKRQRCIHKWLRRLWKWERCGQTQTGAGASINGGRS
eukprot:10586-Rhodomonas_salina.1